MNKLTTIGKERTSSKQNSLMISMSSCKYHSVFVPPKSYNTLYQTYLQSFLKILSGKGLFKFKRLQTLSRICATRLPTNSGPLKVLLSFRPMISHTQVNGVVH